jgi:predicted Rossmann fold nucleotide-binding protein DprA/Smf involved in DNA uptake
MLVGITGHRPERLGRNWPVVERWIAEKIDKYRSNCGEVGVISGMAQGVDQIAARVAIKKGVGLKCYFPFPHRMSDFEKYAIENAEEVRYEFDKYVPQSYTTRDRRIVDDCDVLLVVWDGVKSGGTYYTYKYALEKGKKVEVFMIPVVGADLNRRPI